MNANNKPLAAWLLYSSLIILFSILALKLRLMTYADDVVFSNALNNTGLIDYLTHRYQEWSGRIVIDAIMVTTITIHAFWKIMIPLCLIFSGYLLWSITLKETINKHLGTLLAIFAILLISAPVADNAQWWVTGFYNYLLPVTCALLLLHSFLTPNIKKPIVALSILLSFIATSSEQVAILLLLCTPFIWAINHHHRASNTTLSIGFIAIIIGSALTLLSPGSAARFYIEAYRYMPQIVDMNILQKSMIGVDRLVENMSVNRNLCFIMSAVSLLVFIIKNGKNDWMNKIHITVVASCLIAILITNATYFGKFYTIDFAHIKVYFSYLFYLLALISMATGSIENIKGERDYSAFVIILAGAVVTIAIGLSPTAYASGERVLYVLNISLIAYTLFNFKRAFK